MFNTIGAGYQSISNNKTRDAFKSTDVDENGKIIDIYTNQHYEPASTLTGSSSKEGGGYNREHIVPQSLFNKQSPMVTDMHNLFPSDTYTNGKRGDYLHAYVSSASLISSNNTKIGSSDTSKNDGYSANCCEPADEYKGDVARVYFYMVTRYEDLLSGWKGYYAFDKTSYPALSSWAIKTYLKWSDEDPVSEKEIKRNNEIFKIQKNRNPFVDHPEAAHFIWDEVK